MGTAWAEAFSVPEDSSRLYEALLQITQGLEQLETELDASPLKSANKDLYRGAISTLREYCKPRGLSRMTVEMLSKNVESIYRVQMLDDVLPLLDDRQVDADSLAEVRELIDDALRATAAPDIEPQLAAFLRLQLTRLLWAIDNVGVVGIEGLSRAFGSAAAELCRAEGMKGAKSETARAWFGVAKNALAILGGAVIFTGTASESADKAITHGAHIVEVLTQGSGETHQASNDPKAHGTEQGKVAGG